MAGIYRSTRYVLQNAFGSRSLPGAVRFYSQKPDPAPLINVDVDSKTGVATVTMNSPPVNTLNTPFLNEMGGVIKELEKNKTRGLILTSSSNSVFSAGLDIMEMYKAPRDQMAVFWTTLQNTWLSLYRTGIPTVAAINGHAPAGGCLLALSCEYRVMVGPKFTIGLNETQLGIVAPPWFLICMREAVGPRQTELALTSGKMFTATEALNIGLVDQLVSNKEEALAEAHKFIARFAKIPPLARKLTKEFTRQEGIKYMEEKMLDDLETFVDVASSPSAQKGMEMYLEALKKKST
ncbi:hypothetical protein ONE63_002105 [Megalurothrips usitatus]|uniref:Enoyl-CoA delta isomerase 1, mitochondrial n=1 Tax=Megalurothrips usitatus TaxID=439358 RepID=A0AAV7XHQ8_9NEOP|nr:hypothetical protein ONE63_002105 [Megalurothrips usitatus]